MCMRCHSILSGEPYVPRASTTIPRDQDAYGNDGGNAYLTTTTAASTSSSTTSLTPSPVPPLDDPASYARHLESELHSRTRLLASTEASLLRVKTTTKKALSEFQMLQAMYTRESMLRKQAEFTVESLKSELERSMKRWNEAKMAEMNVERLKSECTALGERKKALEEAMRDFTDKAVSSPQIESPESENMEHAKEILQHEISRLQEQRVLLHEETAQLEQAVEELRGKRTRLLEETETLEQKHKQITDALISSATIEVECPAEFTSINELATTLGEEEVNELMNSDPTLDLNGTSRPPLPSPRDRKHGLKVLRRASKADAEQLPVSDSSAVAKKGWKKEMKAGFKAGATKVKKVTATATRKVVDRTREGKEVKEGKEKDKGKEREGKVKEAKERDKYDKEKDEGHSHTLGRFKLGGKKGVSKSAHHNSIDNLTDNPSSDNSSNMPAFGVELEELYQREGVPEILRVCTQAVEARALDFEGIYRKSGPLTQTNHLMRLFNAHHIHTLNPPLDSPESEIDIMAVTSVLKQWFRELPTPLLGGEEYDALLLSLRDSPVDDQDRIEKLKIVVQALPESHRETLAHLMRHLKKISDASADNYMTPANLGVVFGPSLVRGRETAMDMMKTGYKNGLVEGLVKFAMEVFGEEVRSPSRATTTNAHRHIVGSLPDLATMHPAGPRKMSSQRSSRGSTSRASYAKSLPALPRDEIVLPDSVVRQEPDAEHVGRSDESLKATLRSEDEEEDPEVSVVQS
ncbi:Rho-type gtpase-activating protein [Gaertneriomyces sp. JEL0708]|nr:Rho-type gtpase-activating protein [Gaertneriomyces sp. JEL0708]